MILIRSFLCVVIGMLTKYFMDRSGIGIFSKEGVVVIVTVFLVLEAIMYLIDHIDCH